LRNIEIKTYDGMIFTGKPREKKAITVQNRFAIFLKQQARQ